MLSVGDFFKKRRAEWGVTLEQVEKETRIRKKFLRAVEETEWAAFPSKIYATGIVKNYARYLNLDPQKMLAFFRRDYARREDMQFKKRIETKAIQPTTRFFVTGFFILIVLFFGGYFAYQIRLYVTPPALEITAPTTNTFRSVERIQIVGKTEPDATVVVFGDIVIQNREGTFGFDLPLKKGTNDFVVTARGANGKETTIKKVFILE